MNTNSFILYSDVTEVYDKLIDFCALNGFKVKEKNEKYIFITGKKFSLFFWRNMRMELKVQTVEKQKVEVIVMIYKYGNRKPDLENEYRTTLENFLSNSSSPKTDLTFP